MYIYTYIYVCTMYVQCPDIYLALYIHNLALYIHNFTSYSI